MEADVGVPGGARPSRAFVRQATGLVREASALDAALYNLMFSALPFGIAFLLLFGPAFYVGADLVLAIVLAIVIALPIGLLYAMLSSAVPRSGADYPWISRALSPALGLMSNLSLSFWVVFYIGVVSVYLTLFGITPVLRVLGAYGNQPALLDLAASLNSPAGYFVVGAAAVVLSGILLSVGRGLSGFLRFQRWVFLFWLIGAILLPVVVLALAGATGVQQGIDDYVQRLGGPAGAFAGSVEVGGYAAAPTDIGSTLLALTLPWFVLAYTLQSAYFGGEVKTGRRAALVSIPGAQLIALVTILVLTIVALNAIGAPFLAALGLGFVGAVDLSELGLGFTPFYTELAAATTGNLILGLVITVGMMLVFVIQIPQNMLLISRNLFAWSIDGLVPEWVGRVNERTSSPVNAVALIVLASLISVAIVSSDPTLTALVVILGEGWTYLLVAVAGIFFVARRSDIIDSSPFKGKVGGIHVVTLVAAVALVTVAVMQAILILDANSGTSWVVNPERVVIGLIVLAAGLPIYYLIRALRRAGGVDIDLGYREIPPD